MHNNADKPKPKVRKSGGQAVYFRCPPELHRGLRQLAKLSDRTVAYLIRDAVERYVRARRRPAA